MVQNGRCRRLVTVTHSRYSDFVRSTCGRIVVLLTQHPSPLQGLVTYIEQHANELHASIARFGQIQFSVPKTNEPLALNTPDGTMSHIPRPPVFSDLPDDVDISTIGSSRNDKQEAPPVSILEEAPLVTTMSHATGFALPNVYSAKAHARLMHARLGVCEITHRFLWLRILFGTYMLTRNRQIL